MYFVNRDVERETAVRAVEEWQGRHRPLVLSVSGPGGLGKTELAYVLARKLRERFPDGVLTVDLDELRVGGEFDPGDALNHLLDSLGVESAAVARPYNARCRQYWRKTADSRLIVVLDNARYASEIIPLLPASGNSLVIVASHGPLYDLEAGAAVPLALPPLEHDKSLELLELLVQDQRLAADPEAAHAVVRLCDGLPAALHVAGQWVRSHPLRPLQRLISQLRSQFDEAGVPKVERVWDAAYRDLPPDAALLYRLLAVHPGPVFTQESATALLGRGEEACEEALEELGRAGLIDLRFAGLEEGARMRLPGPLLAHARRRAQEDGAQDDALAAQARLILWTVRQAQRADEFAAGRRLWVAERAKEVDGAPDVLLEDPRAAADDRGRAKRAAGAMRWLHANRHVLFACVRTAHARGLDAEVVALCEPLWTYALDHPRRSDVVETFRLGVDSAVRCGQVAWIVRMRCQLARHLWEAGELEDARREVDGVMAAAGLLGRSGDERKLVASAVETRGMLSSTSGDWRAASEDFARSREIHTAIGNAYGVALQTYRLGQAAMELGELEEAERLLAEAHAGMKDDHRERMTARVGLSLGRTLLRLGRGAEARPLYEQALESARRRGSGTEETRALDALVALAEEEGDEDASRTHRAAADAIRVQNGLD
ncbi:tetratricopeptide repeat protein [Streptantibioticus parmotrematis]|uniref:tetratricopeptide repeat protein n=1 Tax=Streptantibioticus parmotrematis TaxID=2873249 RepID=UPI0033C0C4EF